MSKLWKVVLWLGLIEEKSEREGTPELLSKRIKGLTEFRGSVYVGITETMKTRP